MTTDRGAELLSRMSERRREMARLEAQEAADMLALRELRRSEAIASGFDEPETAASFAADEIAVELKLSVYAVQGRIHAAETVRDDLPTVWWAHQAALIDAWRVRIIAENAWRLKRPESLGTLDSRVVEYAIGRTPSQLKAWLRRLVVRLEPEQVTERRKRDLAKRAVYFDHDADGVAWMHAMMSSTDAALLDRDLTLGAKAAQGEDDDGRTLSQLRADLVVDRLLGREGGQSGRGRFHIGITIPLRGLLGLDDACGEASDGSFALPPAVVRELALQPDTLFSRIITDPRGGVLDVTELGRFPSDQLRRALELVDGVCVFPTCTTPAVRCDKDHQEPHPRGPTQGDNLWNLCRRHHRMKTRGVVDTDVGADGHHRWLLPSDRRADSIGHLERPHVAVSRLERKLALMVLAA